MLTAQAFTSLSLISLLTWPLLDFTQTIPVIASAVACLNRIGAFCEKEDPQFIDRSLPSLPNSGKASSERLGSQLELNSLQDSRRANGPLLKFTDASFGKSVVDEPILHDLNFSVRKGLTMIIGPVGSGKSTLLESMLGETIRLEGTLSPSYLQAAYCSQVPWLANATIKDNIIGPTHFDQERYEVAIAACGLTEDLQSIPGGDMRITGSKGIALSGGQKQRVVSSNHSFCYQALR